MSKFDEAWLAAYQQKMAETPSLPLPDRIWLSVPIILKLPNTMSGRHWSAHMAQRKRLRPYVETAVQPFLGRQPMLAATVTITRYSTGNMRPDWDNLFASAKPLIDLLLVASKTHPHSFGLIVDDDPKHLIPRMLSERCATRKEQRTEVLIERR